MSYTKEQLERASKLAMKGLKLFDGATIVALRNANFNDEERDAYKQTREALKKARETKGGMK